MKLSLACGSMTMLALSIVIVSSRSAVSAGQGSALVRLQSSAPGALQTGHIGITGTATLGSAAVYNAGAIEFGYGVSDKQTEAGMVAYQRFSPDSLDIVGAGNSVPTRKIKFWADGGAVFTGTVSLSGLQMATGSATGRVLTSDASGNATWQAPAGSSYSATEGITLNGNVFSLTNSGVFSTKLAQDGASLAKVSGGTMNMSLNSIGIAQSNPTARLHVGGSIKLDGDGIIELGAGLTKEANAGKIGYQTFSSGLDIVGAGTTATNRKMTFYSEGGAEFKGLVGVGMAPSFAGIFQVQSNNGATAISGFVNTDFNVAVSDRADGNNGKGLFGEAHTGSGAIGVWGVSSSGTGVFGESSAGSGVYGKATASGVPSKSGVFGESTGTDGTGVRGEANSGTFAFGLYGKSTSGYAGYFSGNVFVDGSLQKMGGSFKIDHPMDPENKTLSHSFVESPDMMNVYNGNVRTNAKGEAWVELPAYFDTLNRDFRYQLTVIEDEGTDGFCMAKVSRKIKGNRFLVRTSVPNVEVSWQVTGIRQDPWANKNRIPNEEDKPEWMRGYYLSPGAYGLPEERGVLSRKGSSGAIGG